MVGSEALLLGSEEGFGSKCDRVPLKTSALGNKDRRSKHILPFSLPFFPFNVACPISGSVPAFFLFQRGLTEGH